MDRHESPFFIGWSKSFPAGLVRLYLLVALAVPSIFGLIAICLGSNIDDPSRNLFAFAAKGPQPSPQPWLGDQEVAGSLTRLPYPILHVSSPSGDRVERSLLLSGSGKRGSTAPALDERFKAAGGLLKRGDIEMLVVDDDPQSTGIAQPSPKPQPLGRWRTVGEICDGKCYPGGMTPGGGLAHRACAAVCLIGAVPAILVVAAPVAGATFLVLAAPDGGPADFLNDFIARPIEVEGDVERLGTILILRVDPAKVRLL